MASKIKGKLNLNLDSYSEDLDYIGLDTETTYTDIVNYPSRTIAVNVTKLPGTLTILENNDGIVNTVATFDGSKDVRANLSKLKDKAIIDYPVELPEVSLDNKNTLARLSGDAVYAASYVTTEKEDVEKVVNTPNSNQCNLTMAQSYLDAKSESAIVREITNVYGLGYQLPDEEGNNVLYNPFKIGVARTIGMFYFKLTKEELVNGRKLVLRLRPFFTYSNNKFTTYQSKVWVNGTLYELTNDSYTENRKPDLVEINLSIPDNSSEFVVIMQGTDPEDPVGTKDNRRCFFFEGISLVGGEVTEKAWHELARKELVDINTTNISINKENITNIDNRVTKIENTIGTVQIFDTNSLPLAEEYQLDKIYRFNGKLYQCVKAGEGFVKRFSFKNVTNTTQVYESGWNSFATQVTENFNAYWTGICEEDALVETKNLSSYTTYTVNTNTNSFNVFSDPEINAFEVKDFIGTAGNFTESDLPIDNLDYLYVNENEIFFDTFGDIDSYNVTGTNASITIKTHDLSSLSADERTIEQNILKHVVNTYYDCSYLFRNYPEGIRLGNSSNTGKLYIQRKETSYTDEEGNTVETINTYPITRVVLHAKTWRADKPTKFTFSAGDDNGSISQDFLWQGSENEQYAILKDLNIAAYNAAENKHGYISVETQEYVKVGYEGHAAIYGDPRLKISQIDVFYGTCAYDWVEISGSNKGPKQIIFQNTGKQVKGIRVGDDSEGNITESLLRLKLINFTEDDIGKSIYLYRVPNSGHGHFTHPTDYSKPDDLAVTMGMGYANTAGQAICIGGEWISWAPLQDWQKADGQRGYIQTEWILTSENIKNGYLDISMGKLVVNLLCPADYDDFSHARVLSRNNPATITFGLYSNGIELMAKDKLMFNRDVVIKNIKNYIYKITDTYYILENAQGYTEYRIR